jgi:hypothetical protein
MSVRSVAGLLVAGCVLMAAGPTSAGNEKPFFDRVVGNWTGPGEIVAGKYKGTKFVCTFAGESESKSAGMALDGSCRVGLFSQKMRAEVRRAGDSFSGSFLDGAAGKGLDIVSGTIERDSMVVGLNRKQLKGAMVARLADKDSLNITVSVRVAEKLVPVIGMRLKRGEDTVTQTSLGTGFSLDD